MDVSPADRKFRYLIDERDAIAFVSPRWLAFARENGAPELTQDYVVGRCLWDFVSGSQTQDLYREIVARARTDVARMVLPFRCDSPTLRRFMRLEITQCPRGTVAFEGVVNRVEPRARLNLLDSEAPRSDDMLTLCSFCKRALVEPVGWLDLENAAARLNLLEASEAPQIRQAVCPTCSALPAQ